MMRADNRISIEESNVFWRLKALAVFTVFFAHLPYKGESQALIYLFNYLGMVGVPAFLMLAGFFECTSRSSWRSKLSGLFIPLLIWGTAGYLPSLIFGNMSVGEAVTGYFKWIYGCGSWLYFVPVLFWCKLMSSSGRVWFDIVLMCVSLTSIILTSLGLIPYNDYFTAYTNPFNFMIYYQIGLYVRKLDLNYRSKHLVWISVLLMGGIILCWKTIPSYFSIWSVPFSICSFILMYHFSRLVKIGESVGKSSYVIYLLHMVPMGIIARRIHFWWNTPLQIFNVIIIFSIIALAVQVLRVILEKLHHDKILRYLGYR